MMWEICVSVRPSECERVVVCLKYSSSKKSIYDSLMFGLSPEDENSTRQTGRVTFDFHSPGSFATRIGEWASAKGKPSLWSPLDLLVSNRYKQSPLE